MARAVALEMELPGAGLPAHITIAQITDETQANSEETWLFHCAGDAYGRILGDLIESQYKVRVLDYSGLYLILEGALPVEIFQFNTDQVRRSLMRRWQQFENWYDLGGFQSLLPLEVRRQTVIDAFRIVEFLETLWGLPDRQGTRFIVTKKTRRKNLSGNLRDIVERCARTFLRCRKSKSSPGGFFGHPSRGRFFINGFAPPAALGIPLPVRRIFDPEIQVSAGAIDLQAAKQLPFMR